MIWTTCFGGVRAGLHLLSAFVVLLGLSAAERGEARELRVGVYDNAPKIFMDRDGVARGLWPDITELVMQDLGHDVTYHPCTWAQCLEMLELGEIDVMPDVAYSEARAGRFQFARHPVLYSWSSILVKRAGIIRAIDDLAGLRVAVVGGSIQEASLRRMLSGENAERIVVAPSMTEAAAMVRDDRADAAITNWFFARETSAEFGLDVAPVPMRISSLHFAFAPETPTHLIREVDLAVFRLQTERPEEFTALMARWIDSARTGVSRWVLGVLVAALAGVLLLAVAALVMRRVIRARTAELRRTVSKLNAEIEQRKVAEKAAFEAQKLEAVGRLTGGVAHDFNNLLAVIMGNLELLRDELSDPRQIEQVDFGIQAARRGGELTRNMLSFAGKAQLDPKAVDLNETVTVIERWAGRTLPANIELTTERAANLWTTMADPGSVESALLNLIVNARDAMPEGGQLTISTENLEVTGDMFGSDVAPGRYAVLSVTDTGEGMSDEVRARVFDPFFSTKPPSMGSGLGLSMVIGFMEQSKGAVRLESEEGTGTVVTLFFPVREVEAPAAVAAAAERSDVAAVKTGARILVVEDEADVLDVLVRTLEAAGYEVIAATSGDEAMSLYGEARDFDLLLSDVMMPGVVLGTELARQMRLERPDLPVIFVSGYASESDDLVYPDAPRLMKPIHRADLVAVVEQALSGA